MTPFAIGLALLAGAPAGRGAVTNLPSASSPVVAVRVVLQAGSQDDPGGREGLAALTAAVVAEGGTKDLTRQQVLERFYPMAASLEGDCRKEVSVFSGVAHRDNIAEYERLMTQMIVDPRFAVEDFERLRNEAIDYLSKTLRGNNDEDLGKWALQLALYQGHPYGHADRGTVQGLKSITLDDVRRFHREHYTQAALRLGVAGCADEAFVGRFRSHLDALPEAGLPRAKLPEPRRPRGIEVTIVQKPADSTAISIGFPRDVNRRDDDFYALEVANSYLGEHRTFNGKLMQDLRGKRGLNYGDYSYIEDFIQDGPSTFPVPNNPRRQQYFSIWLRPVPHDKAAFAIRAALWELDRLVGRGIPETDFEATRSFLRSYSKLWVQTLPRRLGYAMDGPSYGCGDLVTELGRRLPALTSEAVNEAVRRHLGRRGIAIAIVTRDAEGLKKDLTSGEPTPISYDTKGTPAEILKEDETIAAFPLKDLSVKIVPVRDMFEK
jgi:zinc protease